MRPLVVLHLPKTAGTTLRHAVEVAARDEQVETLYGDGSVEAFLEDSERRRRAEVVIGHLSYGMHRHLGPSARYVTLLRDPVDRAVSEYHFIASHPEHDEHAEARRRPLLDFVAWRADAGRANPQTALIARSSGLHRGDDPVTEEDLDRALDRLDRRFAVVGLTDRFDESLAALCVWAGWEPPRYLDRNVTPSRPAVEELDPATRDRIAEVHRHDAVLVARARTAFDALVASQGREHARVTAELARRNGPGWQVVRAAATRAASLRHRLRRGPGRGA